MGADLDILEVVSWSNLESSVSCVVKLKTTDNPFRVITVYGSPYEEGKERFIAELHPLFLEDPLPTLIGGDFNLVRYAKDKSNENINSDSV